MCFFFFFFKLAINNRYTVSLFKNNYEPEYHSFSSGALPELRQVPFSSEHIFVNKEWMQYSVECIHFFPFIFETQVGMGSCHKRTFIPRTLSMHSSQECDGSCETLQFISGVRSSGNPQSNSCSNALENLFRPTLNTFYFFCLCQLLLSEASLLFSKSLLLKWS